MTTHEAIIRLLRTMQAVGAETVTLTVSKSGERRYRVKTRRPLDVRDFYEAELVPAPPPPPAKESE